MIRFGDQITGTSFHENLRLRAIDSFVYFDQNAVFSLHHHENFCELMYVIRGHGTYILNNREYPVGPGSLVFINRMVPHNRVNAPGDPMIQYLLSVELDEGQGLPDCHLIPEDMIPVMNCGEYTERVEQCCRDIFNELKNKEPGHEAAVFLLTEQYLLLARRILRQYGRPMEASHYSVEDVKNYLDLHYNEEITLEQLEKRFHMSRYHIVHQMKKDFGVTPVNYIIDRRIGAAQDLLNTTEIPVVEIAARVGYSNQNNFNKIFRKRTGVSPTDFRKTYINLH